MQRDLSFADFGQSVNGDLHRRENSRNTWDGKKTELLDGCVLCFALTALIGGTFSITKCHLGRHASL